MTPAKRKKIPCPCCASNSATAAGCSAPCSIKRVPDSETRVRISPDGLGVDRSGVKFDMNEYDKYALEEAIRLVVEAAGGS